MSSNRLTKIKIVSLNGSFIKTIPNASLNYNLGYDAFVKMLGLSMRLSPQDPIYDIQEVMLHTNQQDSLSSVVLDKESSKVLNFVLKQTSSSSLVLLTVKVGNSLINQTSIRRMNVYSNIDYLRSKSPAVVKVKRSENSKYSNSSQHRSTSAKRNSDKKHNGDINESFTKSKETIEQTTECYTSELQASSDTNIISESIDTNVIEKIPERNTPDDEENSVTWKFVPGTNSPLYIINHRPFSSFIEPIPCKLEEFDDDPVPEQVSDIPLVCKCDNAPTTDVSNSQATEILHESVNEIESKAESLDNANEKSVVVNQASRSKSFTSPLKIKTASTSKSQKQDNAILSPLYQSGKTAAETAHDFDNNMRNYSVLSPKGVMPKRFASQPRASVKSSSKYTMEDIVFSKKSKGEGRPSTGTIEKQWEFMKAYFANNNDEELEWLMVAKRNGAYKYAKRKSEDAEDKYFKSLFEVETREKISKLILLTPDSIGFTLPKVISGFTEISQVKADNDTIRKFTELQSTLLKILNDIEKNSFDVPILSEKTLNTLKSISVDTCDKIHRTVRRARDIQDSISSEFQLFHASVYKFRKMSEDSLNEMEKWSKREKESVDYISAIRLEEEEWLSKELVSNNEALRIMRTYIPVNISELSVSDLMNRSRELGGLFTIELASELKNNRMLHWIVCHKDDIIGDNFLVGEKKQYFENLESLDIIEIRALLLCIPEIFALDKDGRKAEWRSRFISKAKQMIAQQNGESLKGGWNNKLKKRSMIKLPPLKSDQERRQVYFYRTIEQTTKKLSQFEEKEALLNKKMLWLEKARAVASETKKEYDIVLVEMRDASMKLQYGAEQYMNAKNMAKREWNEANQRLRTLEKEVNQLMSTIQSAPISKSDFIDSMNELKAYFSELGHNWEDACSPPIMINGVFDSVAEILPRKRVADKFLSAEEEAEIRKLELLSLKMKTMSSLVQAVETEALSELADNETSDELTKENEGQANPQSDVMTLPIDAEASSTTTNKRKVLEKLNPSLLNTLNSLLSSPQSIKLVKKPAVSPKRKSISPYKASVDSISPLKSPNAALKSKSKFLCQIAGNDENVNNANNSNINANSSFLDQIKKRNALNSAASVLGSPKLSFLDQIKAKKGFEVVE